MRRTRRAHLDPFDRPTAGSSRHRPRVATAILTIRSSDRQIECRLRALARQGRLVTSGATIGSRGVTELRLVFWKQLEILGSTMGSHTEFREVMRLVFDGVFQPVIQEVMPLEDARRAHEILEDGHIFGKLVLTP